MAADNAASVKRPRERRDAIIRYLLARDSCERVDVLDASFVDWYAMETGALVLQQMFGAHKCPMLGRDLSALRKLGALKRHPTGLWGMAGMGFPRWVYCYQLVRNSTIVQMVSEET